MIERNVHHAGKIPRRTCGGKPVSYVNTHGKWAATFEVWAGNAGDEYKVSTVTSGAVFDTEQEAYAATDRALDVLQATDKFPNMCVPF